ncbi:hypothetical protein HPP92_001743 [Vanilla planifolia]|uniref:non-specific serine/threonine protein kinase n=1 Tax=Vanilla planifolia TaxID=51239 RepID=A0A835S3Y4_VANPL|nr:hypothetical protein HPP92_001743 [Vanilla planifolia]
MLDLSNNSLSGPIPPDLAKLSNLEELRLSSNMLTGTIPYHLANCTKLLVLDISQNLLSGSIPEEIVRMEMLRYLFLSGNKLTGLIPDSFTASQNLLELQLGNNMLEEAIPYSLGNLQYISLALNLSRNRLTSEIPASLGNLDKLQSLDLSFNFLSGFIPSELNNMASLSFVNVSSNHLSGVLPASWAKFVATLPNSFLQNPALCIKSDVFTFCKQEKDHKGNKTKFLIIFTVILVLLLLVAGLCAASYHRMRFHHWSESSVALNRHVDFVDLPKDLTYECIMHATEELSEKYLIGKGKYGTVYKAQIDNGLGKLCYAVKKIDLSEPSFSQERKVLAILRHRNLVRMAGYGITDGFGMIIYEYMQGGTLFEVLHQRKPRVPLNWELRHRIALGIAQGLSYLHHDCVSQVIHRDIKSSNILMDSELEPKIGDFGMAKIVDNSSSDTSWTPSSIVGTLGYIAPENGNSIKLTEKSDVYSYGVVILELLCRRMSVDPSFEDGVDIVTWVNANLKKVEQFNILQLLDKEISYWMEIERSNALKLLELAMSCTQRSSSARPSMRKVVANLVKLRC